MKMRPTKLIFGGPKAARPLMLASPTVAIDLPLKLLVWEEDQGKTWISFNSPDYLKDHHNLPTNLLPNIALVETWPPTGASSPAYLGLPRKEMCRGKTGTVGAPAGWRRGMKSNPRYRLLRRKARRARGLHRIIALGHSP